MAKPISLKDLVQAISGAIAEAQGAVERNQMANLLTYFEPDGRPRMLTMKVPATRPSEANGGYDDYVVPWLTLIQNAPLRISEVDVQFDVELGELQADDHPMADDILNGMLKLQVRELSVFHEVAGLLKRRGTTANIKLKIEGIDQPEGVARLLADLNTLQGRRQVDPKLEKKTDPGQVGN